VLRGRRVHPGVRMLVVPGSEQVRRAPRPKALTHRARCRRRMARAGLFDVHRHERRPGGPRPARGLDLSNRNFEGRQGKGARTMLASPLTAAVQRSPAM
jgi:3-isopropylmalate/(R)-2-methylmalate dehydratase large subunit